MFNDEDEDEDEDDEKLMLLKPENVETVLNEFFDIFKGDPREYVPIEESIQLFQKDFQLNDEGEYEVSEEALKTFMDKINALSTDRLLGDLAKRGYVEPMHDGNDFCFRLTDKGKEATERGEL
jgi:hypothetical protein